MTRKEQYKCICLGNIDVYIKFPFFIKTFVKLSIVSSTTTEWLKFLLKAKIDTLWQCAIYYSCIVYLLCRDIMCFFLQLLKLLWNCYFSLERQTYLLSNTALPVLSGALIALTISQIYPASLSMPCRRKVLLHTSIILSFSLHKNYLSYKYWTCA